MVVCAARMLVCSTRRYIREEEKEEKKIFCFVVYYLYGIISKVCVDLLD